MRPSRKDEKQRFGEPMLKKVRQLIESVNGTLKGQLDLERHGGRSTAGVSIPSRTGVSPRSSSGLGRSSFALCAWCGQGGFWSAHTAGRTVTRSNSLPSGSAKVVHRNDGFS